MGSEMCIRDRNRPLRALWYVCERLRDKQDGGMKPHLFYPYFAQFFFYGIMKHHANIIFRVEAIAGLDGLVNYIYIL